MRRSLSNAVASLAGAHAPAAVDFDVDGASVHDRHDNNDDVDDAQGAAVGAPPAEEDVLAHHELEEDDDDVDEEHREVGDAPGELDGVDHDPDDQEQGDDALFGDDDEQDGDERGDDGNEHEHDDNGVGQDFDDEDDAPDDQVLGDAPAADNNQDQDAVAAPDAAPNADAPDADADADADADLAPASLANTADAHGWFRIGYIQPHLDTISGKGQDAARWLHANFAWLQSLAAWSPFDLLRAVAMLIGIAILITMSRFNLPYRAADFLFSILQKLMCVFFLVLPTTVRQFCAETSLALIFADASDRGLIRVRACFVPRHVLASLTLSLSLTRARRRGCIRCLARPRCNFFIPLASRHSPPPPPADHDSVQKVRAPF